MKLQLNREYAMRHLGVAVLFLGLCGWFLYDGAITYPKMDDTAFSEQILHGRDRQGDFDKLKKEAINRQYQFAGICGIAAILIAVGVGRCRLQRRAVPHADARVGRREDVRFAHWRQAARVLRRERSRRPPMGEEGDPRRLRE